MADELDAELEDINPNEIIRLADEAEQGGSYDLEEGIRIFEARADVIIAAQSSRSQTRASA